MVELAVKIDLRRSVSANGIVRATKPSQASLIASEKIGKYLQDKGIPEERYQLKVRNVKLANDFVYWDNNDPAWN